MCIKWVEGVIVGNVAEKYESVSNISWTLNFSEIFKEKKH